MDPIEALKHQLARDQAERANLPSKVTAFRQRHKVTDEECLAMIQALGEGRATTIEEAYRLAKRS